MEYLILLAGAFALGSIPSGQLISCFYGVDLKTQGSGNTGATNAARVLGKKAGVFTLIADFFKGSLASLLPVFFHISTLEILAMKESYELSLVCGLFAVLGHCFSPFLRFNGGKGVATGIAVFSVTTPFAAAVSVLIFALVFKLRRVVSLASIIAALSIPFLLNIMDYSNKAVAIALVISALVVFRHKANIIRLREGKEKTFTLKGS